MTITEISKRFGILPKDAISFIQANATFPVKRNFQTGEMSIPDDVDIDAFFAPLVNKAYQEKVSQEKQAVDLKIQQEKKHAERSNNSTFLKLKNLKEWAQKATINTKPLVLWMLAVYFAAIQAVSIPKQ